MKKPEIKIYKAFGSKDRALIMGHLFKSEQLNKSRVSKNIFKNALEMVKRYKVKPWKRKNIIIEIGKEKYNVTTDRSGYFDLIFTPSSRDSGQIKFRVYLDSDQHVNASGMLSVIEPSEIFISDFDDTIVVSHSTSLIRKIYTLLSRNHERRKPVEGARQLYHRLYHSNQDQLFIYVSSSEWNLYDFINDFCEFNKLPKGYFLLQDLKSGWGDLIKSGGGSHNHKYDKIMLVSEIFSKAKITLIGDSGQKDPKIYEKVAMSAPDRIKNIYIRSIKSRKQYKLEAMKERMEKIGVKMNYFE